MGTLPHPVAEIPSRVPNLSADMRRCSSVMRCGIILQPNKLFSAEQAYEIGEVFCNQSAGVTRSFKRTLAKSFISKSDLSGNDIHESRYRMSPAIIVDFPEIHFSGDNSINGTARVCFTAGVSPSLSKIWYRFSTDRNSSSAEALRFLQTHEQNARAKIQSTLLRQYSSCAQRIVKDVDFAVYSIIRIVMFSFADEELGQFLNRASGALDSASNFASIEKHQIPPRYEQFLSDTAGRIFHPDTEFNEYKLYRSPISRKGLFGNDPNEAFAALLNVRLTPTETTIYGICFDYATKDPDASAQETSAHIASGELSFELGRLY